jgi:RNAse (barnase) inhibitor barstar
MKALFITIADLKAKSIIDGNTDADKLIHQIEVAQDMHIQNYLGGNLYDKLQDLIISGDIDLPANSDYKALRDSYIKPMLIWFTQLEYLPFAMFKIDNGGINKHRGQESDTVDFRDVDRMQSKITDRAEFYTKRFLDYICFNSQKFPEYNNNSNGDMYPDKDANSFSSFVL